MAENDWAQLDGYGQVIGKFRGSHGALCTHLKTQVRDVGRISTEPSRRIYLPGSGRTVRCLTVTLDTPWGNYRYIPAKVT